MKAVNLIPAEQREGAAVGVGRSEGAAYAIMGLLAGAALLVLLYGMAKKEVNSRSSQAASLAAQAQSSQAQASALVPYTSFAAMREQREQAVSTLVDSRFDWAHAFHELGRVIPPNVSIASLTGTIASASTSSGASAPAASAPAAGAASAASATAVASATPPGAVPTFTLTGCAVNQKDVALFLVRLRLMDGVSAVTLGNSTASATAGSSTGACGTKAPIFTLTVAFEPLPTTAAETASATSKDKTVASTTAPASTAAGSTAATSSGSALR